MIAAISFIWWIGAMVTLSRIGDYERSNLGEEPTCALEVVLCCALWPIGLLANLAVRGLYLVMHVYARVNGIEFKS